MHRAWHAAGKVVTGSFMTLLMFGAVAVVGAVLGHRAGAPTAQTAVEGVAASQDDDTPPDDTPSEDTVAETDAEEGLGMPGPTPAEVLAARFPAAVAARPFSMTMVIPGRPGTAFDPGALSGMALEPQWPGTETPPLAPAAPSDLDSSKADPGPVRRSSARSPYVLNEAMIVSIKRRLRLTADQERLWLPVEAALRKLVYSRAALNPQRGQGPIPYIDAASSEDLKTAAIPLIGRLNEGQKREVRDIVHVMGLTAVAAQF